MTEIITCKTEGCKRSVRSKGWCNVHFKKWRKGELDKKPRYKICKEEKCNKPMYRRGQCEQHYDAWLAEKKKSQEGPAVETAPEVKTEEPKIETVEAKTDTPKEEKEEATETKEVKPTEEKTE